MIPLYIFCCIHIISSQSIYFETVEDYFRFEIDFSRFCIHTIYLSSVKMNSSIKLHDTPIQYH